MTVLFRPGRLLLVAMVVMTAACDFGKVAAPAPPDQSAVPFSTTDITVGTGAEAVAGTTPTVQYGTWLYNDTAPDHKGTQVDASQTSFLIGATPPQVIAGFEQGVTGMKVGGTRRVIVPPSLAFGTTGTQGVPPNAALVFDIALTALTVPQ